MKYTKESFLAALNEYLVSQCGVGYADLPDVVCIDDYFWNNMTEKQFGAEVKHCADDILIQIEEDLGL